VATEQLCDDSLVGDEADPQPTGEPPGVTQPGTCPDDAPHHIFVRGRSYPRAIAWFGFTSFWGHLWHLAASVIATEDIDARDWMQADDIDVLTQRVANRLQAQTSGDTPGEQQADAPGDKAALSLTEALDADLWIDFLADTGDDSDVSAAVADMLLRDYQVQDPDGEGTLTAPRGKILIFGGDTAYPVATQVEIHNRVCVPFGRILRQRLDEVPRVLLGIPGNHDWYDGLDGFARMFRARRGTLDRTGTDHDDVDHGGQIGHLIDWVEAFRVGRFVAKRHALPLAGYLPVVEFAGEVVETYAQQFSRLEAPERGQQVFFLFHRVAGAGEIGLHVATLPGRSPAVGPHQ
jgi:hypothetical protein